MRGLLSDEYRHHHANAPKLVPWHSGSTALHCPGYVVVTYKRYHSCGHLLSPVLNASLMYSKVFCPSHTV